MKSKGRSYYCIKNYFWKLLPATQANKSEEASNFAAILLFIHSLKKNTILQIILLN